jgi:hypothetical protein
LGPAYDGIHIHCRRIDLNSLPEVWQCGLRPSARVSPFSFANSAVARSQRPWLWRPLHQEEEALGAWLLQRWAEKDA